MVNSVEQQKRIWGDKYKKYGLFFGEKASDTAAKFISSLKRIINNNSREDEYSPALNVLDVGAGTGRDSVAITLQTNANVDALDCSPEAIEAGRKFAQEKGVENRINWVEDDFLKFKPTKKYDAVFTHRWFHLNHDLEAAVEKLSESLKETGLLVISARSTEDYNPTEMKWVNKGEGIAEYTTDDKNGMIVHLFNSEKFKKLFGPHFDMTSVDFSERVEPDHLNSDRDTKYIFMAVFKKSAEGQPEKSVILIPENSNRWSVKEMISDTGRGIKTALMRQRQQRGFVLNT